MKEFATFYQDEGKWKECEILTGEEMVERANKMLEEITRLNNIINELEKDMNNYYEEYKDVDDIVISENARVIKIYLDKLKELKGGNNG